MTPDDEPAEACSLDDLLPIETARTRSLERAQESPP